MEEEKSNKTFGIIILFLFIIYITLYISQATGYYDFKQHEKVQLTNEKIEKFEEDVRAGKKIDIKNYLDDSTNDYGNGISQMGLKLSNLIKAIMKKGIGGTLKFLESLLSD